MSKALVLGVLVILITACGVKKKEDAAPAVAAAAAKSRLLSATLFLTGEGKFVVHASRENLIPGGTADENTVVYRFVTSELLPVDIRPYAVEIEYDMPDMPQMGIYKDAEGQVLPTGELSVKYPSIVHGSHSEPWEFRLHFLKEGAVVDTLTYRVLVPIH